MCISTSSLYHKRVQSHMSGSHSRSQAHLSLRSSSPSQLERQILHRRGSKPRKRTRMNWPDTTTTPSRTSQSQQQMHCGLAGKQEAQATPVTHHAHDTSGISSSHRPWAYSSHAIFTILTSLVNIHCQCQPARPPCGFNSTSTPCGTGNKKLEPRLRQHKPHGSIHLSSSTAHHPHLHPNPPPSATSHRKHRPRPRQLSHLASGLVRSSAAAGGAPTELTRFP